MTTATTEKKALALKDDVLAIAQKIEAAMTIDNKTGIVTTADGIYEQTLPEGLTMAVANQVHAHDSNFIAGAAHAIGQIAVAAMKGNKKLETAETVITMAGKNTLALDVARTRSYPNPKDPAAPIVKHAVVTPTYDVKADNTGAGQLKVARQIIAELGSKLA